VAHTITHHRIRARVRAAELAAPAAPGTAGRGWPRRGSWPLYGHGAQDPAALGADLGAGEGPRVENGPLFALETPRVDE
jgi:hypothetical protein